MATPANGAVAPDERIRDLYAKSETRTAQAFEELVSKPSFGRILALTGENVAAITSIGSDLADLVLRNLRLAGRADVTRLARQLHRTEDKLERVLQELEGVRDELAAGSVRGRANAAPPNGVKPGAPANAAKRRSHAGA
jgi:HAMP domain-containing protein